MDKDENNYLKKYGAYLLLALIIVVQLSYSIFVFCTKKQALHSDEIWCYGLANSYHKPFIYLEDNVFQDGYTGGYKGSDITNKWIDGKVMNDYLTVQEGERFNYASVYHNQVLDHHPPLYYAILHTICSFFPDSFSLWYSFSINLVSMVFIQIFLFKLSKLFTESNSIPLIVCLLYGAGTGALSTIMFLRQYCFMTMLILMYYYFSIKLYKSYDKDNGFNLKKYVPPMALVAFLLFFTNYTMAIICGSFTAFMCLYMLCRKKIKQMFIYGFSMVGALGAFCAAYPYVIKHTLLYKDGNGDVFKGTYKERLMYALDLLLKHTVSKEVSIYKSATIYYIIAGLVIASVVIIPLAVLFRKETWFLSAKEKIKESFKCDIKRLLRTDISFIILFSANLVFVLILPLISDVITQGPPVARYLFVIMPVVCLSVVYIITAIFKRLPRKGGEIIALLAVLVMAVKINIYQTSPVLKENPKGYTDLTAVSADKNVLLFASHTDFKVWYIQCFPIYLRKANSIFVTSVIDTKSFENNTDDRKVDIVIAPVASFKEDGEWYEKISETDSELFGLMEESWKYSADAVFEQAYKEQIVFADQRLEKIADPDNAEVLYCINIQNEYYAVIQLNS